MGGGEVLIAMATGPWRSLVEQFKKISKSREDVRSSKLEGLV
jgi:hypothetical protein